MEDEGQDSVGTLGVIRDQLGEMLDPSTTVEAQGYARRFLDKQLNSPLAEDQKKILTEMEKQSKAAQETLRAAREKLLARQFNPSDRWYALSRALGAPTRVGGIGELASRAAGALGESRERREAYGEKQRTEALGYDEKINSLGMDLLKLRSAIGMGQGKIDAELAKESLKTLGKRVNPAQTGVDKAQQALDREYVKDYLDWNQNGQSVANKSITELSQVRDRLRGYSVDAKGVRKPITEGDFVTRQLGPTGRVIGSIATVPYVGKAVQDVIAPGSADIREIVESTVQSSLRPILGPQFTEKEGERLIARVYNTRMKTEVNTARVQRLLDQIVGAAKAKDAAAKWFEAHGTMKGFQGKYKFTLQDFMPPDTNELAPSAPTGEVDDHGVPYDGPPSPFAGTDEDNNAPAREPGDPNPPTTAPAAPRTFEGKRIIKLKDLPKRGYAEGGSVSGAVDTDTVMVELPDGRLIPMPADATQEDVAKLTDEGDSGGGYDSGLSRAALAALGAGVGYGAGKLTSGLGSAASDLRPGAKETPAQARLLRLMERSNLHPSQVASSQRRFSRLGVPTMPLDFSPDLRAATETAMTNGGPEALEMMDRLRQRQAAARSRSLEQVNKALKPDEYFDKEQQIKDQLYGNRAKKLESESSPLYRAAESQFPAVTSQQLGKLMDTPTGKKAVKAAMQTMKDKGKPIGKVNPVTGAVMRPSLEFLNQVKIEMDNLVGQARSKGKDAKAKDIGSLRTSFREELDTATTDPATGTSPYKEARETYESRKAHLDALQAGREEFGRMQPQEVAKAVAGMNFEQKDAFRTGVAQNIKQMLETPSTDINAAKRLIGSPAMEAKLAALFDNPNEFAVFKSALEKEVEVFENSQKLLQRESTVRQRGASPPKGRVSRTAEKAPSLGILSPTHWALKILREKPEITQKEAAEVINLMKSSSPDEIASFEKSLAGKFGRAAARKKRGSRMGMAGAALGAVAGMIAGGDEDQPVVDEGVLAGLDDGQRAEAMQPAGFAEGGKASAIKNLIKELKDRLTAKPAVDVEDLKNQVSHVAIQSQMSPADVWREITGNAMRPPWETAPDIRTPTPQVRIPAQPEKLAPFARSMDFEKARLEQLRRTITDAQRVSPEQARALHATGMAADSAFDQMMADPNVANMERLSQLVRSLQEQSGKCRGGRIGRQFGGRTNHA